MNGPEINGDTAAICGLFCGICHLYPNRCGGCMSDNVYEDCAQCDFRECAVGRGIVRCSECSEIALCELLSSFEADDVPHHSGVIASVERLRNVGMDKWLCEQVERNTCPVCGKLRWWDRPACNYCGAKINGVQ